MTQRADDLAKAVTDVTYADEFYDAFISYVTRGPDAEIASALQRDLESFRVPRKLVEAGYPTSLRPIFRDVSDLPATSSLRNALQKELRRARFLIVLCSPRARSSQWVNEEIHEFLALGRGDRILAVLIAGEPPDSFPPALEVARDSQRSVDAAADGPLAADLRPQRDQSKRQRRHIAVLRLAATILGCSYDDLARRAEERSALVRRRSATGIAIVLIALVGVAIVEQRSQRTVRSRMAADRLHEETVLLARNVTAALEGSDPVMNRLGLLARDHDSIKPFDRVAHSLCDLMIGRPGVAYITISFPDGTFQGAYRDEASAIRFQDSRVGPGGTVVTRYTLVGHERITPYYEEHSTYDPRTRAFYKLAVSSGRRVWTQPYPFFGTHYTGITRAEPVLESGSLHAVITVDFDVTALSAILSRFSMEGASTLIYTRDGMLLAYPNGEGRINDLPLRQDRALLFSDLDDPLLNAFFQRFLSKVRAREPSWGETDEINVNGKKHLVVERPINVGSELDWSVATIVPESVILR